MFGFRFIKFEPGDYVMEFRNGRVAREGVGLSFFYYAPNTSIVVVPVGSAEVPFIFEEITSDFQTVTIQGQAIYRIADPGKIAKLMNYTLDTGKRNYKSEDSKKLPQRIINIIKVLAKKQLSELDLKCAIRSNERLAGAITREIQQNSEINSLGIEILGVSILTILPNKETSRALEAQAREELLKKADEAIYERRNASIEQERRIKENELNTEIAVENKKRQIKETQMEAERAVQKKKNELQDEQMGFEIALEDKKKSLVELASENARAEADSKAYELSAVMKSLEGINPSVIQSLANMGMKPGALIAMAFQGLAEKAEKIGQLNISPDLLQELVHGSVNYENARR